MHKSFLTAVVDGGLLMGLMAGCTPKPNEEQLQELNRVCAAADEAESALEQTRRDLNSVERQLTSARQSLQERQAYLSNVRQNLVAIERDAQ